MAWTAGTVSLFAVTGTWLQGYGMELFSLHMVQHMALSMVVPPLLLLGAPLTLALRTLPRGTGAAGAPWALLLGALHSRVARAVSHPLLTMPLYIGSLYGVYFTPLVDTLMSRWHTRDRTGRPVRSRVREGSPRDTPRDTAVGAFEGIWMQFWAVPASQARPKAQVKAS